MFNWFKRPPPQVETKREASPSIWSTHAEHRSTRTLGDILYEIRRRLPVAPDAAMDDSNTLQSLKQTTELPSISDALVNWYASQSFIGWQLSAILAQNWLIDKACSMTGRDAIRNGYDAVTVDGDELEPDAAKILKQYDRKFRLAWNLEQWIRFGRIFGIRLAIFDVRSTDPKYYEKPFNLDGVTPGSYKGIIQVDPYWAAPMLDGRSAAEPDTAHFYEPTWWQINGKKYHRSHLLIYRHGELPDILKPAYMYGGVPVPQQIMERVFAAERTANEAPQLAATKRTNIWLTDMGQFVAKGNDAISALNNWSWYRDNYGIKLGDKEGDQFQQFDTSLTELDEVIMTQYQIVAAAANVPATKLLGTTPKGFNSTGDYEESSYHEELESIQTHDLTPFLERHHALVYKAFVEPAGFAYVETTVNWRPLDAPTAKELAETNLLKAQTGAQLVASGALASEDERKRLATDPESGYPDLGIDMPPDTELMTIPDNDGEPAQE